jgi:hypothetical protein
MSSMLTTKNNNKAISTRENTMSTWKMTVSALVLGLVFCGAANAAVLTITFEVTNPAAVTQNSFFDVRIYGQVSGMDATNISEGAGGIADAEWTVFTPAAGGPALPRLSLGQVKDPTTYTFATNHGFKLPPGLQDYGSDGDNDLVGMAVAGWNTPDLGMSGPVLLGTQTWKLIGTSAVLNVWISPSSKYVDVNDGYGAGSLVDLFDQVTVGTAPITVGASGNTAPTVTIPGGNVTEPSWSDEPGWNNLAHSVTVTAVGVDAESNPLTYAWTMIKPGGASKPLAATGAVLNLTLAEIASLGLPAYVGADDPSYHWSLSVTANDGLLTSGPAVIAVFVPEPATMGLLAFGVVGLLKRRRRA